VLINAKNCSPYFLYLTAPTPAQVELEYETSKPKQPDADLHKTYHLTLALIQQGSSVEEIMKNRDFATSTVLGHINKLVEENLIGNVQRRALYQSNFLLPIY
jgi:ATP-dependent DNA helicase RecQ